MYVSDRVDHISANLPGQSVQKDKEELKHREILDKPIIDLENIVLRLLMIGQRQQMEFQTLFNYMLCTVHHSLIDEHGCLRKANKSGLVKCLGVINILPTAAQLLMTSSWMFFHIVWPSRRSSIRFIATSKVV